MEKAATSCIFIIFTTYRGLLRLLFSVLTQTKYKSSHLRQHFQFFKPAAEIGIQVVCIQNHNVFVGVAIFISNDHTWN